MEAQELAKYRTSEEIKEMAVQATHSHSRFHGHSRCLCLFSNIRKEACGLPFLSDSQFVDVFVELDTHDTTNIVVTG